MTRVSPHHLVLIYLYMRRLSCGLRLKRICLHGLMGFIARYTSITYLSRFVMLTKIISIFIYFFCFLLLYLISHLRYIYTNTLWCWFIFLLKEFTLTLMNSRSPHTQAPAATFCHTMHTTP